MARIEDRNEDRPPIAGLMPTPDAMTLWLVVMGVWLIGWFWHRYR